MRHYPLQLFEEVVRIMSRSGLEKVLRKFVVLITLKNVEYSILT